MLKLLRLIPIEYQSGVRDGEVVIPLKYREVKSFAIQVRQMINELLPVWRKGKAQVLSPLNPQLHKRALRPPLLLFRIIPEQSAIHDQSGAGDVSGVIRG